MKEIKAIIQPFMADKVLHALAGHGDIPGVTMSQVVGWGRDQAKGAGNVVHEGGHAFVRKTKLEIVVKDDMAEEIIAVILEAAHTGRMGDGKLFVLDVDQVVKIRTGEKDHEAL